MRVLITGGAGFIGTNLIETLTADSSVRSVVVVDDLSNAKQPARTDIEFHEASILDADALARATAGCDAVVHLAAIGSVPRSVAEPLRSLEANAMGTAGVLQAATRAGVGHVIVASSSSVYGANPTLPKHEGLLPQPVSPYAVSKLATETAAIAWASCYDLRTLAFRFFNVYGPHQPADHDYAAVIPRFTAAALAGEPLPVHGDGTQSRDFTFVDTVTTTIADALRRTVAHETPVNLALGTRATLLDVVDCLATTLGRSLRVDHQPQRAGDVPHSQADATLLRSLFPDVQATSLAHGIEATVHWMRSSTERAS
jgi:UDP-glucose 4-epimerase